MDISIISSEVSSEEPEQATTLYKSRPVEVRDVFRPTAHESGLRDVGVQYELTRQIGLNKMFEKEEHNFQPRQMFCEEEGHKRSALTLVCAENSCKNKGLVCRFCILNEHEGHKFTDLGKLVNELADWNKQFDLEKENISFLEIVTKSKKQVLAKYREHRKQFDSLFDKLDKRIERYFDFFGNSIKTIKEICQSSSNIYSFESGKSSKDLNNIYHDLASCFKDFATAKKQPSSRQVSQYWSRRHRLHEDTEIFWKQIFQSANTLLAQTAFELNAPTKDIKVMSRKDMKHINITLFEDHVKIFNEGVKQKTDSCCLLTPSLGIVQKQRWHFKIHTLAWMKIGVISLASARQQEFKDVQSHKNSYCLRNDGTAFSAGNFFASNCKFYAGNVIKVTYDPIMLKLTFRNLTTESITEVDLQTPLLRDLHPFVQFNAQASDIECNPKLI